MFIFHYSCQCVMIVYCSNFVQLLLDRNPKKLLKMGKNHTTTLCGRIQCTIILALLYRSTSVINRAHNYEAVLPNFSTKPKEWKAQNYEVPLAQSGTLQRNTPTNSDIQRSLTMKETHSVEKTTSSSLDGPIYMNYQHADTCTQSRSLVDRPYMDSLKKSLENLSYVGYKIRKMDTSDESCEV